VGDFFRLDVERRQPAQVVCLDLVELGAAGRDLLQQMSTRMVWRPVRTTKEWKLITILPSALMRPG
jgi:hypothetical protein